MFSPWSGLAAYISYLSQKQFDIILSLEVQHGAMEIVCNEKWCSYTLREGSVLQNDEMFSEVQNLISQCFPWALMTLSTLQEEAVIPSKICYQASCLSKLSHLKRDCVLYW